MRAALPHDLHRPVELSPLCGLASCQSPSAPPRQAVNPRNESLFCPLGVCFFKALTFYTSTVSTVSGLEGFELLPLYYNPLQSCFSWACHLLKLLAQLPPHSPAHQPQVPPRDPETQHPIYSTIPNLFTCT